MAGSRGCRTRLTGYVGRAAPTPLSGSETVYAGAPIRAEQLRQSLLVQLAEAGWLQAVILCGTGGDRECTSSQSSGRQVSGLTNSSQTVFIVRRVAFRAGCVVTYIKGEITIG